MSPELFRKIAEESKRLAVDHAAEDEEKYGMAIAGYLARSRAIMAMTFTLCTLPGGGPNIEQMQQTLTSQHRHLQEFLNLLAKQAEER